MSALLCSEALPRVPFGECPLCESKDIRLHATANCSTHKLYDPIIPAEMKWLKCIDCSHVFTDGHFSAEQNKALFAKVQPNQVPGFNIEHGRLAAARVVEHVSRYAHEGLWLDIGFGDGALLMTAQEYGYEPRGIDLRPASVEGLLRFGIEAEVADIASYEPQKRFDIISMADVLEHMPYPGAALGSARELLRPNGILFVSCPNMDAGAWRHLTANDANPYWIEIEHFHNFTRRRLSSLLSDHGFKPIHYAVSERYRVGMEIIARKA
jgi:SAM-dependent methyltransferase